MNILFADIYTVPFRASALPAAGLALALTSSQAFVWTYANATSGSKILTLPLPPALKGADPLPIGNIVRNGPTNDFGVVAVAPSTGRIVFWENIDSAEARSLFAQRKQGVEGWVKLYSGERVTRVVDVDHAGYILVLSSGRLAQLILRDAQGRPNITTTILNTPNGSSGGFFGLKGLLGGAIKKTIASVKGRPSFRGQMEVVAATRNGVFQLWDLSWSGQQIFKYEIDARQMILDEVQLGGAPEIQGHQDVHILDFAILGHSPNHEVTDTLVLVALSGRQTLDHFLLEVDFTEGGATISRAIPLPTYQTELLPVEATGTLLLPDPGHTALVQFPDAIVVASLARPDTSPEAQLFFDSGATPLPFQDCIYFKSDAHVRVVGYALEPSSRKNQTCAALLFIQDFGILQINAYAPPRTPGQDGRSKVTAMSKLMQATFFSTVPGTILDFNTKGRASFSQDEVEKAALQISEGILSSSFEQLSGNSLLLEDQLGRRALALRTLNKHLRAQFSDLSFSGRWELLSHAEKLAATMKLWDWYQKQLRRQEQRPGAYPEKNIIIDIVKSTQEKFKTPVDLTADEHDQVRQFFLSDIDSLDVAVPWAWNHFRVFYIAPGLGKSLKSIMQRLHEANQVYLIVLDTAFSFRKEHVNFYGLDADSLDVDGVLKSGQGYDKLASNFWTSSHNMVTSLRAIIDAGNRYAVDCYEKHEQEGLAQQIGHQIPGLVQLSCANHIERCRWGLEQGDAQKRAMGRKFRDEWDTNIRPKQIHHLITIGLATEGMNLAERYNDMPTLVDLIWEETLYLEDAKLEGHGKMVETEINLKLGKIKDRVKDCFKKYKNEFADAYFSKYIDTNNAGELLKKAQDEDKDFQASLTNFLNASDVVAPRNRLAWVNNVRGEEAFGDAAVELQDAAQRDSNIWCKTAELSIAKLCAMAQQEADADPSQANAMTEADLIEHQNYQKKLGYELEVARVQNQLYEYVLPTITTAMDDESAVQLLMTEYGQGRLVERPALQHLLQQGFDHLVQHQVVDPFLLIDVLTLMVPNSSEDLTNPKAFNQFALALKVMAVITASDDGIHPAVRKGLLGLIWKRLLLQDDWQEINATQTLSREGLSEYLGQTLAGSTIKTLVGWSKDGK